MGLFDCCLKPHWEAPQHTDLTRDQLKALFEKSLASNSGRLIVHGVFARADTKNNNKRVYPKHVLQREVKRFKHACIKTGTAIGELDHPSYASQYFRHLNLGNASHQVLDIKWQDGMVYGAIEILPTPSGLLLWELYSQGVKLGVSSRGWASLRSSTSDGTMMVDDDFELITFDFVNDPSTTDAYLLPLIKRFTKHVPDQSRIVQLAHLGYGSVLMKDIMLLPYSQQVVAAVKHLRKQHSSRQQQGAGLQRPQQAAGSVAASSATVYGPGPGAATPELLVPRGLEHMHLTSHYCIHEEPFICPEAPARQYKMHLAMFATKAHLADIKAQFLLSPAGVKPQQMQQAAGQEAAQATSIIIKPHQELLSPAAAASDTDASQQQASDMPDGIISISQDRASSSQLPPDIGSPVTDHPPEEEQWTQAHSKNLGQLQLPDAIELPAAEPSGAGGPSVATGSVEGAASSAATLQRAAAQVEVGAAVQQDADPDVQMALQRARETLNAFAANYTKCQVDMRKALKLAAGVAVSGAAAAGR